MAVQVMMIHLVLLVLFVLGVDSWKCAKYENYFSQQPDYIDCLWDCCGNSFNRHCCAPIGIIVGCCIVGAVIVAALTVLMMCWWQRRRAKEAQGPRLFHNQRHSHYPVAPSSVTRPAPLAFNGPETDQSFKRPLDQEYGQPREPGYRPGPPQGYRPGPPPRSEKPPFDEFSDIKPPLDQEFGKSLEVSYRSETQQGYRSETQQGYRSETQQGYRSETQQGYRPPPRPNKPPFNEYDDMSPRAYRPGSPKIGFHPRPSAPERAEKLSLGSHSSERAIDI